MRRAVTGGSLRLPSQTDRDGTCAERFVTARRAQRVTYESSQRSKLYMTIRCDGLRRSICLDFGMVEMGSPSKMAARRRCAEIASAPFVSRTADRSIAAEGGTKQ